MNEKTEDISLENKEVEAESLHIPTEEEKVQFLKEIEAWQKKHPILLPGQKKIRNKMMHLIPKKKKRKK